MSQPQIEIRAAGLYLDPSPHSDVPPGALIEASDVVIQRAGIVEPRPGFESVDVTAISSSYHVVGLIPFDGSYVTIGRNISTPATTIASGDGGAFTLGGAALTFAAQYASAAAFKDALYLATTAGVARLDDVADTTASLAGMPRGRSGYCTLVDGPQADDRWLTTAAGSVAYRVIYSRKLTARTIVGAPSGRFFATASASAAKAVQMRLPIPSTATAGDDLQVYRSEVSEDDVPSDELALVLSYSVTASDISTGYVDLVDVTPQAKRGAALYTNATQAGATQEHAQPPVCKVVRDYGPMLFFGQTQEPARLVLEFTQEPTGEPASPAVFTADFTNTSTGILNADWADDLDFLGMTVVAAGGPRSASTVVPADTILGAIGGGAGQWTLSNAAIATSVGESLTLADRLYLDDNTDATTFYFYPSGADDFTVGDIVADSGADEQSIDRTLAKFAAAVNLLHPTVTASALGGGVVIVEAVDASTTSSIDAEVNRRLAKRLRPAPTLNVAGTIGSTTSEQDIKPNRVMFSRVDVPDGVPPTHFIDLGREDAPVMAMESNSRTLLVFKEDGIWRINGRTPESLSVEQIDEDARLLHPRATCTMGGDVYAWLDSGVHSVTETGVTPSISAQQLEIALRPAQQFLIDDSTGEGAWMASLNREGWLLVGVPAASGDDGSEWIYLLSTKTGAWTRWSLGASCAADVAGRLFLGDDDDGAVFRARLSTADYPHHDSTDTLADSSDTISDITLVDGVLTITDRLVGSAGTLSPGDWAVLTLTPTGEGVASTFSGVVFSDDGTDIVLRGTDSLRGSTGTYTLTNSYTVAGTVYIGPTCAIEWTARTAQNPLQTKQWGDLSINLEVMDRFAYINWAFRTDLQETAEEDAWWRSPEINRTRPGEWMVRGAVPRAMCRGSQLFAKAQITNGGAKWALSSLAVSYNVGGMRAGKRAP